MKNGRRKSDTQGPRRNATGLAGLEEQAVFPPRSINKGDRIDDTVSALQCSADGVLCDARALALSNTQGLC